MTTRFFISLYFSLSVYFSLSLYIYIYFQRSRSPPSRASPACLGRLAPFLPATSTTAGRSLARSYPLRSRSPRGTAESTAAHSARRSRASRRPARRRKGTGSCPRPRRACPAPRLAQASHVELHATAMRDGHVVTGGTSGLGLLTARWLTQTGVCALALASRSGSLMRGAANEWEQLLATAATTCVLRCDVAQHADLWRLLMLMGGACQRWEVNKGAMLLQEVQKVTV